MSSGYSYGDLRYNYKININLENLMENIVNKLNLEPDDYYFDDTNLVIEGTEKCRFKHWHSDATRYEPSEDETEMIDSLNDVDIEQAVIDAMMELKEQLSAKPRKYIANLNIDGDSYEYDVDEPDPDRAYDEWKDRMLEDD